MKHFQQGPALQRVSNRAVGNRVGLSCLALSLAFGLALDARAQGTAPEDFPAQDPSEEPAPPVEISGSFFSRYELGRGYSDLGLSHPRRQRDGDYLVYRARFGVDTRPVDLGWGPKVSVRFVPQAYGTHATQGSPATIGDAYDLGVYEAFVRLQGSERRLDVGRFMLQYGDGYVIGGLKWNEAGRGFQGMRLRQDLGQQAWVDGFATLVNEGQANTQAVLDGDRWFYGVYAGLGPLLGSLEWDVYLLGLSSFEQQLDVADPNDPMAMPDLQTVASSHEFTFGSRAKQTLGSFDYGVEAALQFGTSPGAPGADALSKLAFHADAEVGIKPVKPLRVSLGGTVGSGDDDPSDERDGAYNQLFPTGHKYLGRADVVLSRSNLLAARAELAYKPVKPVTAKVTGHLFMTMADNPNGETLRGSELDVVASWDMGAGVKLYGAYGVFLPNQDFWQTPGAPDMSETDPVHYFELQFGYEF